MADVPTYTPAQMQLAFDPQTDERSPWVTACEHTFANGTWFLSVPAGFRCDLASIPGPMLWLFGPNGKHQRAALFHDAAYRSHRPRRRSTADEAFRSMMLDDGVHALKAWLMYAAVRVFGGKAWKQGDQRP
jgi:hypothetical protein